MVPPSLRAFFDRRADELLGDAATRGAAARDDNALLRHWLAGGGDPGKLSADHDRCRTCTLSLNIQCWSRQRYRDKLAWYDGEIFKLRQNLWLSPFHGGDEGIDEGLILRPFDARMTPTEIERIVEPPLIIGSDIKCDPRRRLGRDAATAGIERELADGDARAARVLVAEAKNVRPPSVTTIVRTSRSPTASSISSMRSRSG
jgi:hypothetical protein